MTRRELESRTPKLGRIYQEENNIFNKVELPDFEKYKKKNLITLFPPIKIENNIDTYDERYSKNIKTKKKEKSNFKEKTILKTSSKTLKELESQEEEDRVKNALFEIAKEHIYLFKKITKKVVESKYKKIFEDIYHFIIKLDFYNDSFLQTLMINTDQNADVFFERMENYFEQKGNKKQIKANLNYNTNNFSLSSLNKRNYNLFILKESNFYDLKNLFIDLQLYEDKELKEDAEMEILPDNYNNMNDEVNKIDDRNIEGNFYKQLSANIIIVREIHLINPVNFNIFLTKLIDFNLVKNKRFSNVVLFDVSYDPKGLFEKIKPNILTKIVFNNLDYISSKTIYKEILYDFVHGQKKITNSEENSFFIPNSQKTKKIIDYVTTHQISIPSFEYYFKFLILEFFVFKKWENNDFLIYHTDLSNKLKKINFKSKNKREYNRDDYIPLIEAFFKENLKLIKNTDKIDEKEILDISEFYLQTKNTREVFLTMYEFFENIVDKLGGFDNNYNKYDFIFDFLQFGETESNKVNENRTNLIMRFIKEKNYLSNIIKNLIIPELDKLSNLLGDESEQKKIILNTKNEINKILREKPKIEESKEYSKRLLTKSNINNSNHKVNPNHAILKLLETGNKDTNFSNAKINYDNNYSTSINENNRDVNNSVFDEFHENFCLLDDDSLFIKLKVKFSEFFSNMIFTDFDKVTNLQNSESNFFLKDFENENSKSKISSYNTDINNYLNFNEITNPSMQSLLIKDIFNLQFVIYDKHISTNKYLKLNKNQNYFIDNNFLIKIHNEEDMIIDELNFLNNINYSKLFKFFLIVYGELGLEFKLKFFFSNYLIILKCESEEHIKSLRNIFLKFCHEFYLLGLISRKRPGSDIFVKNFFKMTKYFLKR